MTKPAPPAGIPLGQDQWLYLLSLLVFVVLLVLTRTLLVGVVIGGVGRLAGASYGALFIVCAPALAESDSKGTPLAVYGVLLILVVFAAPGGIAGLVERLHVRTFARTVGRGKSLRALGASLPSPSIDADRRQA